MGGVDNTIEELVGACPEGEAWPLFIWGVRPEQSIREPDQQQGRLVALDQLAAGVAHYFNGFLQSIIKFAEQACFHPDIPEAARLDVERIVHQCLQAACLVRQLMDFGLQTSPRKQPVDFISLIKEAVSLLGCVLPPDIRIAIDIEPGCEAYGVNADPVQIQQALMNLATNAEDAMGGSGTLRVQVSHLLLNPSQRFSPSEMPPGSRQNDPEAWVALSITDTGVGIPPEVLPHIFEPFFITKELGKGVGLGLAQVYGIVRQHAGYIDVESVVGKGTTFTIYLPSLPSPRANLLETAPAKIFPCLTPMVPMTRS